MYSTQNGFTFGGYQQPNYQQQSFQQPNYQMASFQQQTYSCRPVTSREEVAAAQIDFMGPGAIFPDLGHGVVYLKRFNSQTGSSDILEFRYAEPAPPRDELGELRNVVSQLQKDVEALKGGAADAVE